MAAPLTVFDVAASTAAASFVDPLNHLQLELLRRRRAGDDAPSLRLSIQQTVTGIAAQHRLTPRQDVAGRRGHG